jgi:hypothetical protein
MSLVLSNNQQNIVASSTPVLQDWGFTPGSINIDYYQGAPAPAPVVVATKIKDVLGTSIVNGYTDIRYNILLSFGNTNNIAIATLSGEVAPAPNTTLPINQNGIQGNNTYTFQNLNLLAPGVYTIDAWHRILGTNSSGSSSILSNKIFKIKVTVFPATAPVVNPASLSYVWQIGQQELMVQPLTINAPNWSMRVPANFFPSGNGFTIAAIPEGNLITGSGETTINFLLFDTIETFDLPTNPYTFQIVVNGGIINIPVQVTLVQSSGLFIAKDELYFEAYKGISNAPPQYFSAYFPGQYDFICPPWLTVLPHPASYSNNLGWWVLGADNMEPGLYEADVIIFNTATNEQLGIVRVVYNVIGNISLPYGAGEFAYTLDNNYITFSSLLDDAYFEVAMNVRVYEFYTNAFKDYETINFKVPLYNKSQKFNIGQTIDRLMLRMGDLSYHNQFPYLPAEVSLSAIEKRFSDPEYSQQYALQPIQFIAGLQPQLFAGSGLLDICPYPSRQTPESYAYLNLIISNFPSIRVLKNGGEINNFGLSAGVNSLKIDFANLGAAQGDIFEYRIETGAGNFSKLYKIIPPGKFSNYIVWENEYKLQSVLEFTGEYDLKSEFENRSQSLMENLVQALTKLESSKTCKLTINTGYILKSEIPAVESLCRAKRAALILDGKVINLVPVQKNMTGIDSQAALIAYDVEFEINRKYNEEVYLF